MSEEIIVDPEEVQAQPQAYRQMGEEVIEQPDYPPAKLSRRRIICRKYVTRDEPHHAPIIAELDTLAERSHAAPGLLARIIVSKYNDHLPAVSAGTNVSPAPAPRVATAKHDPLASVCRAVAHTDL